MINLAAGSLHNLLDAIDRTGRVSPVRTGTVVKAEVVDITGEGNAVLRLVSSNTGSNQLLKTLIQANTDIPLTKGQYILLEILGDKNDVRMRFIGNSKSSPEVLQKNMPARLVELLATISEPRLDSSESTALRRQVRKLPKFQKWWKNSSII